MQHSPHLAPAGGWPEALIIAPWPEPRPEEGWEAERSASFNLAQDVVRTIRNLRAEKGVQAGRRIPAVLVSASQSGALQQQSAAIASLAQLDASRLQIQEHLVGKPEGHIALVVGPVEVYLPLAGLVDPG